jgi:predicted transposase/invertase (TIGR01784 family)
MNLVIFVINIIQIMAGRTFISFDWAIKKVLRHKENFTVLEGFLSELLGFDIKIQNLLESEANKQHENDKFDRVDILVKSQKGELLLIEVQYDDEDDYFHRMVYGISKLISEYIAEGQPYGAIKKAYSINIMYFRLGQGKDYIYEYEGKFVGRKKMDILNPTNHQKIKYGIESVSDIFPKYFILRVGSFKEEKVTNTMDEWMYFLKKSEIKDDFTAKGMAEAKQILRFENMQPEDKAAYKRHIENRRIEMGVMETAIDKAKRKNAIDIAKVLLLADTDKDLIAKATKLTLEEIIRIERGEELDKEEDDDE